MCNIALSLLFAAANIVLIGQTPLPLPNAMVDLSSPQLQVHASLPQNNGVGLHHNLLEMLKRAEDNAKTNAIVAPGLDLITDDEVQIGTRAQLIQSYQTLACLADAIVVGHSDVWLYHPTKSGTSIYTDYDFAVDQVIKDNDKSPLKPHIVLTRPGGSLQLGTGQSKTINFKPETFPALERSGKYVMFLKFVPASGGYENYGANATLIANAGQWMIARKALSSVILPEFSSEAIQDSFGHWLAVCPQ